MKDLEEKQTILNKLNKENAKLYFFLFLYTHTKIYRVLWRGVMFSKLDQL